MPARERSGDAHSAAFTRSTNLTSAGVRVFRTGKTLVGWAVDTSTLLAAHGTMYFMSNEVRKNLPQLLTNFIAVLNDLGVTPPFR
jgi:hypothetical protein